MSAFEERKPVEQRFGSTKEDIINIGKSVFIKGELTGDEDLTIEGRVEGKIELRDHNLVIGPNGKITAEINAKNVTVIGSVVGNVNASGLVEIKASGTVVGDLKSPRISVADGAHFKGGVDMQKAAEAPRKSEPAKAEPPRAQPSSFSKQTSALPTVQVK